ncbi:MAG: SLC13 family permease [Parvibaculum sp.]|jgi:di/tricarboxylate transporter|uniref:SLC13 family permease n=1 Tax=Parvibaculum sp. TaxID=2024848 RepID=UPI000C3FC177|nr:SLC13 family permease [Parvibaculum sp.]MAU59101.1 SLC13 family permease [Parvibaculum sp.]MAV92328.1 SLC13 family permease [Pseudobdellovibrionaceae bacterium]|tara:strand:- start:10755 stop:12617 length:1863 start_codon:yes stop_codon:yes gene_type:complete
MEIDFVWQMWVTYGFILAAVILFSMERLSLEVSALAILSALLLFFYFFPVPGDEGRNLLGPTALLAGFANPALLAVLALLVVGQGMFQTGALDAPARYVADLGSTRPGLTIFFTFLLVAVISAFLNNTPVAVMFIPVLATLAGRFGQRAPKVMMTLSYVSILGGMTTLIGSSTNLLAAGVVLTSHLPPIGIFDFVVPGLFLAGIGFLYSTLVVPHLVPDRGGPTIELQGSDAGGGKQYIAQLEITAGHPLLGVSSKAGLFPPLRDMTVRMIQRGEHPILPPFEDVTLSAGDVVIVAATRQTLTEALKSGSRIFEGMLEERFAEGVETNGGPAKPGGELILAETVVAPGSRMIGQTIEQIAFRHQTGCIVLGVQRRSRMIRTLLNDIRLEAGDVLLVLGKASRIQDLRQNRDVLLLEWSATELPDPKLAHRALAIFGVMVATVLTGILPIEIAAIGGALAIIAFGVLNIRQAARAIDRRIFLMVGAMLGVATALEVTGGAQAIAVASVDMFQGYGVPVMLSAFFFAIAVTTNVLTNNATAVLFTPIAISTAMQLGVDPMIFVYAVIFASNCSFATPMGYQTNLLVMGPGHYEFRDFVRAGTPLVILLWLAYSFFAPWYYGL